MITIAAYRSKTGQGVSMKPLLMLALLCTVAIRGSFAQPGETQKEVLYKNISFLLDPGLAKDYVAETVAAVRLETSTDKPDGVAPEHVVVRFRGSPVRNDSPGDDAAPAIFFYPIAEARDGKFTDDFPPVRQAADDLKTYLSRRSHSADEPIPFLPWGDLNQAFIAKRKTVRFRNGRGVLFLTQYDQEQLPVNNGALVYTFQGLTDDNAWYISAVFPVSAPGLPPTAEGVSDSKFSRDYKVYVAGVAERLEKLSAKSYTPNLALLDNIVRSIRVLGRAAESPGSTPR